MSDVAVRTNTTTVGSSSETELSSKHSVLTVNRDVEQCGFYGSVYRGAKITPCV